jgi:hypothetical protein
VADAIQALREPRNPQDPFRQSSSFSTGSNYVQRPVGPRLATATHEDFLLLCPDGTKAQLHEYERCNWGTAPSDAIVTSSARTDHVLMYQVGVRCFNFLTG